MNRDWKQCTSSSSLQPARKYILRIFYFLMMVSDYSTIYEKPHQPRKSSLVRGCMQAVSRRVQRWTLRRINRFDQYSHPTYAAFLVERFPLHLHWPLPFLSGDMLHTRKESTCIKQSASDSVSHTATIVDLLTGFLEKSGISSSEFKEHLLYWSVSQRRRSRPRERLSLE